VQSVGHTLIPNFCKAVVLNTVRRIPAAIIGEQNGVKRYQLYHIFVLPRHRILPGDQIKNNEMGGACGTYGWREGCIQGFGGET
jgi:hypothetical protein